MKFAMITTFFGKHRFGGDATYVDRLSQVLLSHGHEVDIIYSPDSFNLLRDNQPERTYAPLRSLKLHAISHPLRSIAQVLVHQSGRPMLYRQKIKDILQRNQYDVIHFHNISLIGGPELFRLNLGLTKPLKIMTAHEHWLLCPLSLLWKFNRQVCTKKACTLCTLLAGRPPQFWRHFFPIHNEMSHLNGLICPSQHTLKLHQQFKTITTLYHLPYCLPIDWAVGPNKSNQFSAWPRPYFVVAGRLVIEKGFQHLIPIMRHFPSHDLLIAGIGPFKDELAQLAAKMSNIHFLGFLDYPQLADLYRHSICAIMPSLFYETFGYVGLEAFSQHTPIIVRRIGALPELISNSGGGIVYDNEAQLIEGMQALAHNPDLRSKMGKNGYQTWHTTWSEEKHINHYLAIIDDMKTRHEKLY